MFTDVFRDKKPGPHLAFRPPPPPPSSPFPRHNPLPVSIEKLLFQGYTSQSVCVCVVCARAHVYLNVCEGRTDVHVCSHVVKKQTKYDQ